MKKMLFFIIIPILNFVQADPGIMIDIDIIIERPSGPGGVVMGAICR